MRFLADESCDFAVVRSLRDAGHDVVAVAEFLRGASDGEVIDFAVSERRIVITEDKDFGQLVFAAARANSGVVFVRFPVAARDALATTVLDLVSTLADTLYSCFVVVEPGRIRVSRER
jgi:predicted nuclease of predicted toxin-antitoxin system